MGEAKRRLLANAKNEHDRDAWRHKCRLWSTVAREEIVLVSGKGSTVVKASKEAVDERA